MRIFLRRSEGILLQNFDKHNFNFKMLQHPLSKQRTSYEIYRKENNYDER